MPVRTRNEFLDAAESDDDGSQYTDTEAVNSKTALLAPRNLKKRKYLSASDADDKTDSESDLNPAVIQDRSLVPHTISSVVLTTTTRASGPPTAPARSPCRGTEIHTIKTKNATAKPGVIYLSRIPPFMRPSTVRSHLSLHGEISKLFLTPEPPSHYLSRRRAGGNKKHSYIDGWIEFKRKKDAKICVDAINGQIVGGKKGGWYRDDVWNAKYLRGFSWGDLMGSVQAEEREREERVRVGVGREGRERKEFIRNLERSKVEETRRSKREKKMNRVAVDERVDVEGAVAGKTKGKAGTGNSSGVDSKKMGFERRFRQNEVRGKTGRGTEQPDEVKRVLSQIF